MSCSSYLNYHNVKHCKHEILYLTVDSKLYLDHYLHSYSYRFIVKYIIYNLFVRYLKISLDIFRIVNL